MRITVKLFSSFQSHLNGGKNKELNEIEIDNGARVRDILLKLDIPLELPKIILVNGTHSRMNSILKDGCIISIFPPFAGG